MDYLANQNIYINGSRGPSRSGFIRPDLLAPGVNVSGPAPNNTYIVKSGTSCAAAYVAGVSAMILEWGVVNNNYRWLNTEIVKSFLIAGARRENNIAYPNNVYGYGKLDLLSTFKEMSTIRLNHEHNFLLGTQTEKEIYIRSLMACLFISMYND